MADTSSSISVDIDDGQVLTSESVPMVNKSGMHAIYELFNEVVDYGFQVRTKKLNGLNLWNAIKSDFNTDSGNCKWILTVNIPNDASDEDIEENDLNKIYDFYHDVLGMRGGDEDSEKLDANDKKGKKEWEKYHFFLQLARIPKNNDCSMLRLMQVAYNIGQLKAVMETGFYSKDARTFLDENNLTKLDTYVDVSKCTFGTEEQVDDIIEKIRSKNPKNIDITGQNGGSNYLYKYLKYKAKYKALEAEFNRLYG